MTTLKLLASTRAIPAISAWYLADMCEARGKQELFTKQSPQRLKVLREHALMESAVSSSNRRSARTEKDEPLDNLLQRNADAFRAMLFASDSKRTISYVHRRLQY